MTHSSRAIPQVAIACQGGGSHAAFVAGVLMELFGERHRDKFEAVALSGTSGGAMCAALAWAGLHSGGASDAIARLDGFWRDLEVHDAFDVMLNFWAVTLARLPVTEEISPYTYEPLGKPALEELLEKHLRLGQLRAGTRSGWPRLCVGATEVLTGERTVFTGESLTESMLIASAAIPPLFRAVEIGGRYYWDGLFATNPPIRELTDLFPPRAGDAEKRDKELWVVQVNPQARVEEPRAMRDINDRRNELAGNLSLAQELYFIAKINELLAAHASLAEHYDPIAIRVVPMQLPDLDHPSKLDRSADLIERLLRHGAEQAPLVFDERSLWTLEGSPQARAVKV